LKRADSHKVLNQDIENCERCPRLIKHCRTIAREKKKAHIDETYWGKPNVNFGDPHARLLIVGLAPAAHGANRTGRMFTGDRSGQWLYRALHRAGFANQSTYERADDGLVLKDCMITAVAHCAPPDNKPEPKEIANCSEFLRRTFELHQPKVVLALGGIAWTAVFNEMKRRDLWSGPRSKFSHGAEVKLEGINAVLIGSYHPSQQNTFTGRLTEAMFDSVFARAGKLLATRS
jgi:uracil-DNA glycosylase